MCAAIDKMYFILFFVYLYVFYIKFFTSAANLLRNKISQQVLDYSLNHNITTPAVQHDTVKGKKCNNQIIRLTHESTNCESLCGGSYMKKYLSTKNLYPGLDPGVYCIPRELDSCHPYAGMILKDTHGCSCVSKYPFIFSGVDADEIVNQIVMH